MADFGLSRLKRETFLTTKTGKGTVSSSNLNLSTDVSNAIGLKLCPVLFSVYLTYLMWLSYPAAMDGARGVAQ